MTTNLIPLAHHSSQKIEQVDYNMAGNVFQGKKISKESRLDTIFVILLLFYTPL